jgi:hypothetical protein
MSRLTAMVLELVADERLSQDLSYGAQRDLPFTWPGRRHADPQGVAKATYERHLHDGTLSHADIINEELAEAYDAETHEERLIEAVQACACLVKAIEAMIFQREQGGK